MQNFHVMNTALAMELVLPPPDTALAQVQECLSAGGLISSRVLDLQDRQKIIEFRASIYLELPAELRIEPLEGNAMRASEEAWVDAHLAGHGITLGIFYDSELIAYGSVYFPDVNDSAYINKLLKLSDSEILNSAHHASCMVSPAFRGYGIHKKLMDWREDISRSRGRSVLYAMTAKKNIHSLKNMIGQGMRVKWEGEIRKDSIWVVLFKHLDSSVSDLG